LPLPGGIAFGVNVGDLLEASAKLQRDGIQRARPGNSAWCLSAKRLSQARDDGVQLGVSYHQPRQLEQACDEGALSSASALTVPGECDTSHAERGELES